MITTTVKKFGTGLHAILSKTEFKEGEKISISKDKEWEKRVKEIIEERLVSMQSY